jgi:hypothetical protein
MMVCYACRHGAHQLAAAHQQRHQQQREQQARCASIGGWEGASKERGRQAGRHGKSGLGAAKRSKSLEVRLQLCVCCFLV